jgi:hypothetical protein
MGCYSYTALVDDITAGFIAVRKAFQREWIELYCIR